jgi:hypothetical protein
VRWKVKGGEFPLLLQECTPLVRNLRLFFFFLINEDFIIAKKNLGHLGGATI